ncbi:FecCD family ABC transporter permease [Anoxybacterium hadale]
MKIQFQEQKVWNNKKGIQDVAFGMLLVILSLLILFSIGCSVSIGQVPISLQDTFQILLYKGSGMQIGSLEGIGQASFADIIWHLRLPRALMSMLVGAGLSLCGAIMQASVQNPLADPYILGISSGGALGATFAILMGFSIPGVLGQIGIAAWAFAGAFGAALLVLVIAGMGSKVTSIKLLLAGMVINALCNAFSNFIVYFASNAEGIKTVTFWTMGSLASATWNKLPLIGIGVVIASIFFLTQFRTLNTMLLGSETAVTLGISLTRHLRIYMLMSSIVTGIMVASCGTIGFVGLIIPHIVRGILGSDHKRLIPASILFGSIFLIWADILARILIYQSELPIGIITSMIGAPMFMYMLIKKGYGFGGK